MNRHFVFALRRHANPSRFAAQSRLISISAPLATKLLDHQSGRSPNNGDVAIGPRGLNISPSWRNNNYSTNDHQIRYFGSDRSLRRNKRRKVNPFKVLKVRRKTPYATAKKIFLTLAMQHHPDVTDAKSGQEQEKSQLPDYVVADNEHDRMDEWFKQETGFDMPFMDEETMKEVAAMTEAVGGGGMDRGLDRDGGMWDLARMVTQSVKSGGDGKILLQLEARALKETAINNSNLRARRRRAKLSF
ncbi:expressed unknown protein [Seminavis robusta]|uniref:J domain-containing protein n=1 Tax=Seminavis robusta TaxID=568900 RepID=A0A9N8DGF4_9STRA|nr:expressed unknown protein [Seminavis robusta]|eukprot:Sro130_g061850.1 n/a (245) ;mRNA; r:37124-37939